MMTPGAGRQGPWLPRIIGHRKSKVIDERHRSKASVLADNPT